MRKIKIHSVISLLFLCQLVFTQGIVHFLHKHSGDCCVESHAALKTEKSVKAGIAKCKVCSLDVFLPLFYSESTSLAFYNNLLNAHTAFHEEFKFAIFLFATGRAPPLFS